MNPPQTPIVFDGQLATFDGDEMSFEHPVQWQAAHFENMSSFTRVIVYLSTEPLFDPCTRAPNSVSCGSPLRSDLGPNGVFIDWIHWGFPGRGFDPTVGELIDVGGRRATLQDRQPTERCAQIGADAERLVVIDYPDAPSNWHEMTACYRGPDLAAIEAEISDMLTSVRWATSSDEPRPLLTGLH